MAPHGRKRFHEFKYPIYEQRIRRYLKAHDSFPVKNAARVICLVARIGINSMAGAYPADNQTNLRRLHTARPPNKASHWGFLLVFRSMDWDIPKIELIVPRKGRAVTGFSGR
jgi:hypothetical protein